MLAQAGYDVHYNIPEQLCHLAKGSSHVYPLTERFLDLIDGPDARLVMGRGSRWAKAKAMWNLYRQGLDINKVLIQQQEEVVQAINPDLIVFHSKCFYPLLWHLATDKRIVLLTPVPFLIHAVDSYPHIGFTQSMGKTINRWTYGLIRTAIAYSIKRSQGDISLGKRYGSRRIKQAMLTQPLAYAVSPTLVPRPADWPSNTQVVGYHYRSSSADWQAPAGLASFLDRHDQVLFLTFGSMINDDPQVISDILYSVLTDLEIPTIVNCADGGLVEIDTYANQRNFYFVEGIPYSWLLPQVDAMICHGGAGTTHQALLHGLPTMIVPHIMDQHVWAQLVHNLGAGTQGLPLTKIRSQSLEVQVQDL
jgi:UDP:flavonoid glycosyltransferase YjiC (YdhE family)